MLRFFVFPNTHASSRRSQFFHNADGIHIISRHLIYEQFLPYMCRIRNRKTKAIALPINVNVVVVVELYQIVDVLLVLWHSLFRVFQHLITINNIEGIHSVSDE